jgi:hypothetical protein
VSDNEKPSFETSRATLVLNSESASTDPMQAAEERMRRALGLQGEQLRARQAPERTDQAPQRPAERFSPGGHKRRFVHDGEVPVTVVHGLVSGRRDHGDGNGSRNNAPTNRLEIAEAALAAEIATRDKTERALQEAQAAVHDLRTKLGHADLARQEAVEALRREREAREALRADLHEAQAQATAARQAQEAVEDALAELQEQRAAAFDRAGTVDRLGAVDHGAAVDRLGTVSHAAAVDTITEDDTGAEDDTLLQEAPRPRRGRKPRAATVAFAEPPAPAAKPGKVGLPGRSKEPAPTREPKPIRWWLTPRAKKKR